MQLVYIVVLCFVGLSQGNAVENPLLQALTGLQNGCGMHGILSGVRCLSQTHFIYNDDPPDATPFQCPAGKVCVDLPGVCFSGVPPLCPNTEPLDPAKPNCGVCSVFAYTCISQTEYVACSNGEPLTQYPRKCPVGTFCQMDLSGFPGTPVCSATIPETADCSNTVVTPITPRPETNICTAIGLFPAAKDATCKSYFSYFTTSEGQLSTIMYTCAENLIFDHSRQKCVPRTTCNCPP